MSENHNLQSNTKPTKNRPQPPKKIGKPPRTEFINSEEQPTASDLSDIN
ncbi:hypothetical protein NIES4072_36670 [Nostoc commune NIES-4072]|uniref:Uncharacterized protein n=1 Tax=Nostoc commune NIES-4072 TaxID=2005467 RepID=A0A2R5FR71_NOSCO|nr:hypothetical protein NIES4070_54090 [Nostoc commune HK-02]GBG19998.1 hypothetical protein NIES4072_36670 [Nostoc commune NIES-4072]